MPKYTLTYFNSKGLAEPVRYMFHLAGKEYEDKRVSSEEWPAMKPTTPQGHLPILEVDGKQIAQSRAIQRYVGAELGFYGPSALERAEADVVLETLRESTANMSPLFTEKDEAKKAELKKKFEEVDLQKNLEELEKLLKQNKGGDGWFVGDKVSLADIECFSLYCDLYPAILGKECLDLSKFEKFAALTKKFRELPKVAEWIKMRPESQF